MTDQSERLRRMTHYSWHVLRADRERRAAEACDEVARHLHARLAELHLLAAEDLSDAWRDFSASDPKGDSAAIDSLKAYEALFAALYGPAKLEKAQALIPSALWAEESPVT